MVAFDMGGTTAKACLIEHGSPRMERLFDVDQTLMRQGTGLPVVTPTVDLIEIGAGGGSVARVGLGIVEVGPQSAGADPGPVCYGGGGEGGDGDGCQRRPRLPEPRLLPGGPDGTRRRVGSAGDPAQIAEPLELELAAAAWGIHEAVTSNMENAIRSVTIERSRIRAS